MARLSRAVAEQRPKTLDGWTLEGDAVRKQYTFTSFPDANAFVNRLAHSEGGLTEKDFAEATMADRLT